MPPRRCSGMGDCMPCTGSNITAAACRHTIMRGMATVTPCTVTPATVTPCTVTPATVTVGIRMLASILNKRTSRPVQTARPFRLTIPMRTVPFASMWLRGSWKQPLQNSSVWGRSFQDRQSCPYWATPKMSQLPTLPGDHPPANARSDLVVSMCFAVALTVLAA